MSILFYNQWLFNVQLLIKNKYRVKNICFICRMTLVNICCRHTLFYCASLYYALCLFFFSKKYYSFRNRRLVATLRWGSLWAPFSRTLAHFLFLFHFDNSHIISDFFIIIIFVVVICDQWSFSNKSIVDLWYCVSFRCTT